MRGGVPEGWVLASPVDLADSSPHSLAIGPFGSDLKVSDYRGDGFPVVFVRHIRSGDFDQDPVFLEPVKAEELRRHWTFPGDILVTKMGDPPGDARTYPGGRPPAVVTADCIRFKPDAKLGDARFLMYSILSPQGRREIARITRGVAQRKVSLGRFSDIQMLVAPLPEQHRIVAKIDELFSELDAGVAALERAQAKLERYRASVLKVAVEGRLTEQWRKENPPEETGEELLKRILAERRKRWEEEQLAAFEAKGKTPPMGWRKKYQEPQGPDTGELPELPEGWSWGSLDQLTQYVTSGSRGWAKYYAPNGPLFIRAQDINTDSLSVDEAAHVQIPPHAEGRRTKVEQGDLLVTITGANVTKSAVVEKAIGEAYVNQHIGLCRPVDPAVSQWIHLWVVCPNGGRTLLETAAYGAGKPGLNLDHLRTLPVPVPPMCEAQRIMDLWRRVFPGIESLQRDTGRHRRAVSTLRQSILKLAFEGRLVPQDPNDEPASVLLERIRASRKAEKPAAKRPRNRKSSPGSLDL